MLLSLHLSTSTGWIKQTFGFRAYHFESIVGWKLSNWECVPYVIYKQQPSVAYGIQTHIVKLNKSANHLSGRYTHNVDVLSRKGLWLKL